MLNLSRNFSKCPSLKHLANLQRTVFSGRFPLLPTQETLQNASNDEESSRSGYGEKEISLLGPVDIRTPLPGNIGIPPLSLKYVGTISELPEPSGEKCEVTTSPLPEERYQNLLTQAACVATEKSLSSSNTLECIGYDCPQLLRNDFSDLFPSRNVKSGNLTVITLCQKTENDMSEWSENGEMERADLESCFVTVAAAICYQLSYCNYWADFIHPNSGKPNFDSLTSSTLFETDLRYRHLGFTIEDLGCCRVVMHRTWGTRAFTGAIFTNAPVESKEVQTILNRHRLMVKK